MRGLNLPTYPVLALRFFLGYTFLSFHLPLYIYILYSIRLTTDNEIY